MRISKPFKRIASIAVLVIYIVVAGHILGECLEPISYAMYFNHDLDMIEAQGRSVDMVFLGASRVYRTFAPEIIEAELDMDCIINAGTAVQPICATYYQLKDLIDRFHPEHAVIGLTWDSLTAMPSRQNRLIVYDRLEGINKLKYAFTCFDYDEWLYLIDAYRFRSNCGISKLREINDRKKELVETNYTLHTSAEEYYADKGFVYSYSDVYIHGDGNVYINGDGSFSRDDILDENVKYLDACVKLCKDNEINLYLVSGPTTMMRLYNVDNYQDAIDYYEDYARENGIIYHNLNYLKDREEFLPDSLMFDYNHVNGEGAYVISRLYSEILRKDMEGVDTSDYFYDNMDELKEDVNRIVSVKAVITIEENTAHVQMQSLQNDDMIPYYQLEISQDGESYVPIVEWSRETEFDIEVPEQKGFSIRARARNEENEGIEAFQIYNF